jgi:hypothetical protein
MLSKHEEDYQLSATQRNVLLAALRFVLRDICAFERLLRMRARAGAAALHWDEILISRCTLLLKHAQSQKCTWPCVPNYSYTEGLHIACTSRSFLAAALGGISYGERSGGCGRPGRAVATWATFAVAAAVPHGLLWRPPSRSHELVAVRARRCVYYG